jgi:mRNA-degrading endonuclease RelE of RelBE toxin-antitoxin system
LPASSNKRSLQRTNRFRRDIKRLSSYEQEAAFRIATQLSENIFDPSLNLKPLTGVRGIYRVVVVRNYRMVFSFDDENIYLLRIAHRREIYRNLEL